MKILILGASGHVGQIVVRQALERGHSVVVFVHKNSSFHESKQLKIVRGDVHETKDISKALSDCDAVISTLGSIRGPAKDVLSSAMQRLIPVMNDRGIKRIVTLSGYNAFASFDSPTILDKAQHIVFATIAPKVLRDAEDHMRLLQDSSLEWSIVRAPVILNSGKPNYTLSTASSCKPWQTIPRNAVAAALLDLVESDSYVSAAPFIFRR